LIDSLYVSSCISYFFLPVLWLFLSFRREKARSYQLNDNTSKRFGRGGIIELSTNLRCSLFTSLLILKNCLSDIITVLDKNEIQLLCQSFCHLLRYSAQYSLHLPQSSYLMEEDTDLISFLSQKRGEETHGSPSNGQIAVLVFLNVIMLIKNDCNGISYSFRQDLFHYFESKMIMTTSDNNSSASSSSSSGLLHFLLSVGIGSQFQPSLRYLSLHLCSFILQTNNNSSEGSSSSSSHIVLPPALRVSLSHILAIQIQSLLSTSTSSSNTAAATAHDITTSTASLSLRITPKQKEKLLYYYLLTLFSFVSNFRASSVSSSSSNTACASTSFISCYNTTACEKNYNLANYTNLYALQTHSNKINNNNITKSTIAKLTSGIPGNKQHPIFAAVDNMTLLPFNDLLYWIYEKHSSSFELMSLISYFLFQFYYHHYYACLSSLSVTTAKGVPSSSSSNASLSLQGGRCIRENALSDNNNDKKIVSMLTTENVLQMMLSLSVTSFQLFDQTKKQQSVSAMDLFQLTVKTMYHSSEKLKSTVKQLLSKDDALKFSEFAAMLVSDEKC
jgi:hypothetical protein